jgi:exodeoxyribonuclease VII large subunit
VYSVSELNARIRDTLQGTFSAVWVSGEITDLSRPRSGHIYFSLKDETSQLRAAIWRSAAASLGFELEDGMQVVCQGAVDVYPPRGTYQIIVRRIEPLGIGTLQLALLQLRDRLAAEGLFDPLRKRPLPIFPSHVAVVTSPTGAAVRDFLEVIRRRWPLPRVTIVPTRVQGSAAEAEIARAIRVAEHIRPDVILVTRGGGSLEDLWCFNSEIVVRAIHACRVPVVSAIGHEIDVTLSDLVADVRALTPTEAAERIVPDQTEVLARLRQNSRRLQNVLAGKLRLLRTRLDLLSQRPVLRRPHEGLRDRARLLDELQQRLDSAVRTRLERRRQEVARCAGKLDSLSPLAVLSRGYSVTQRLADATIVSQSEQVSVGERILTRLGTGQLISRVEEVEPHSHASRQKETNSRYHGIPD